MEETYQCSKCGAFKKWSDFPENENGRYGIGTACKVCKNAQTRERLKDPTNKAAHKARCRRWELKKLYGLTPDKFQELNEQQNGVCAICGGTNPEGDLCVDHDHSTGKVRALLCRPCNLMLGNAQEQSSLLTKAAAYLTTHSER